MTYAGRLVGKDLLGLVDLRTLEALESDDVGDGKIGEQAKKAADITVLGVSPELPEVPGRTHACIEPHGTLCRLPHLGA